MACTSSTARLRNGWRLCGVGLASLLAGAWFPLHGAPQTLPLKGTAWQLVGIQSMNDPRALCSSPSPGEPLTRQLSYVRGYLLRDGRLHLCLLADGAPLQLRP